MEQRKTAVIAEALGDEYEVVYCVDINTSAYYAFRSDPAAVEAGMPLEGDDFWSDIVHFAVPIMHPDDHELFLRECTAENCRKGTSAGKHYSIPFRLNFGEGFRYNRATIFSREGLFIIAITDVDDIARLYERVEQEETELHRYRAFADYFVDTFISAYYIDLKTLECTVYRRSADLEKRYPEIPDYLSSIDDYISRDVHPDDREWMYVATRPDYILENLKTNESYTIGFRDISHDTLKHYRFQAIRGDDEDHAAIGFMDVTEEVRSQVEMQTTEHDRILHKVISDLSTDFDFVDYVAFTEDKEQDVSTVYRPGEVLQRMIPEWTDEVNFHKRLELLQERLVAPEDRAMFFEATRRGRIQRELERRQFYNVNFRANLDDGRTHYCQLRFVPDFGDFGEMNGMTVGMHDVDSAMPVIEEMSEGMPGGFFIYLADGNNELLFFNNLMVRMYGCENRDDFIAFTGNKFKGLVHPEDYTETQKAIYSQLNSRKDGMDHVVFRISRKDGEIRWLDAYGKLIHFEEIGDVFFVFALDITEAYTSRDSTFRARALTEKDVPDTEEQTLEGLRILIVDDSDLTREINHDILEAKGAVVHEAEDGTQALEIVRGGEEFDLILMDLIMPIMNGVDTTRYITEYETSVGRHTPIIALTAEGSDMQLKDILEAGAYGCLYKPLVVSELSRMLLSYVRESASLMEKRIANTILRANTDSLTGVLNASAYAEKTAALQAELSVSDKNTFELGVIFFDLDNLKKVNDTQGHDSGDRYIRNTADILTDVFHNSPVYRIGGDEFVVFMEGDDYRRADHYIGVLLNRLHLATAMPDVQSGRTSFSFGVAFYDWKLDRSVSDTIKRADAEMYRHKKGGRR